MPWRKRPLYPRQAFHPYLQPISPPWSNIHLLLSLRHFFPVGMAWGGMVVIGGVWPVIGVLLSDCGWRRRAAGWVGFHLVRLCFGFLGLGLALWASYSSLCLIVWFGLFRPFGVLSFICIIWSCRPSLGVCAFVLWMYLSRENDS